MSNKFIQQRQRKKQGGLANAPQGRSISLQTPNTSMYKNAGRLLDDLNIALPGVMKQQQERANLEASKAYKKAQLDSTNMSPEKKAKHLLEAREGIKSGEGRSFFDKFLVDEDKSVEVWDDLEARTLIRGARAKEQKIRAENPFMDEADLKRTIGELYQREHTKASTISKRVGDGFLDGTNTHLDNLNLELTKHYADQRRQQLGEKIITDTHNSVNDILATGFGFTPEELSQRTTDIGVYNRTKDLMTSDNVKSYVDQIMPVVNQMPSSMKISGVATGKDAQLKKLDTYFSIADQNSSVEMFDEFLTREDKDGMTLQRANPELATEMRAKLNQKVKQREAHFLKLGSDLDKAEQKAYATETDGYLSGLLSDVEGLVNSPAEQKVASTAYSKGILDMEAKAEALMKDGNVNASLKVKEIVANYKDRGRGKEYFDDPDAVDRSNFLLQRIATRGRMTPEVEAELKIIGHYMSPTQYLKYKEYEAENIKLHDYQSENRIRRTRQFVEAKEAHDKKSVMDRMDILMRRNNMPINYFKDEKITPVKEDLEMMYMQNYLELANKAEKEPASDTKDQRIHNESLRMVEESFTEKLNKAHEDYLKKEGNVKSEAKKVKNGGTSNNTTSNRDKAKRASEAKKTEEAKKAKEVKAKTDADGKAMKKNITSWADEIATKALDSSPEELDAYLEENVRGQFNSPTDYKAFVREVKRQRENIKVQNSWGDPHLIPWSPLSKR